MTGLAFAEQPSQNWIEIRSPNFTLITDGSEAQGRGVAQRFEQMRAVFGALISRTSVNIPVPLQIVAFRSADELSAFAPLWKGKPTDLAGLFLPGEDLNFIALDLSTPHGWSAVFHEYAHMLLEGNLRGKQLWFDEGFAQYYSTIEIGPRDVGIGAPPRWIPALLQKARRMPLGELFRVSQDSRFYNENDVRTIFYAQSWLVVHYLLSSDRLGQIRNYFDLIDQGVSIEDAVRRAFGMDLARLQHAVDEHLRSRRFTVQRHRLAAALGDFSMRVRTIPRADAGAVLADLHLHMTDYHELAIGEFEAVLKLDPDNAAAHRNLGYAYLREKKFDQAAEHFRRAAERDRKDPRVHYYSALLMNMAAVEAGHPPEDPVQMRRDLQIAIELDPDFGDAYNLLAYACAADDDLAGAISAMRRAVELSPRNEVYAQRLADYHLQARRWDEAVPLLQRLRNSANPEVAARAKRNLAAIQEIRDREPLQLTEKDLSLPPERPASEAVAVKKRAPEAKPVRHLHGTLLRVECSADPAALVIIKSEAKTWKMRVPDRKKLLVLGADALSCSWRDKPVLVNYRAAVGGGELISLELK